MVDKSNCTGVSYFPYLCKLHNTNVSVRDLVIVYIYVLFPCTYYLNGV